MKTFPIMLVLRLTRSATHHVQNYAGIIGGPLKHVGSQFCDYMEIHVTYTHTHTRMYKSF